MSAEEATSEGLSASHSGVLVIKRGPRWLHAVAELSSECERVAASRPAALLLAERLRRVLDMASGAAPPDALSLLQLAQLATTAPAIGPCAVVRPPPPAQDGVPGTALPAASSAAQCLGAMAAAIEVGEGESLGVRSTYHTPLLSMLVRAVDLL